jgi:hypothetical protein
VAGCGGFGEDEGGVEFVAGGVARGSGRRRSSFMD